MPLSLVTVALFPYAASVGGAPPPPPTPTGEGGHCPFFSGTGGGVISGTGAAVCASPPAIRAWQGLKFGLFLHWGAYSQIGFDASWSLNWKTVCEFGNPGLCEPKNCSQCTHEDMQKFRTMYWNLSTTFNPTKFDPTKWAAVAKGAGMKYFVMTTKHHDGFAMYNTSAHGAPGQPVYGVTGSDCPTQRDLFGEVAAAMRAEGLLVGAYYSKADWHAHSFWDESLGFPTDRNVNYNITTNPAKWQTFVEFDKAQLSEIQAQYSPDIYWLDAGWVGQGLQHLPLTTWATEHRKVNPRQLWVNRDGGVVEDYLTPENPPPSSLTQTGLGLRPKPWEVCMTLGQKWAYQRNDTYKTTQTIVQTLVSVVATGGSLLLDVGPMPSGELPPTAVQRLGAAGSWLRVNAEAIYDTMPQAPYAMTVQGGAAPSPSPPPSHTPGVWRLASPASAGQSAKCAESPAGNLQLPLAACQAKCAEARGCDTLNFRPPHRCITKVCGIPGQPLTSEDGGYDVWCLGCANASAAIQSTHQWRLTRKGAAIFATLLLPGQSLPPLQRLALPFVIDAPGGIDGSWPTTSLQAVTLLGGKSVPYAWSDSAGLLLRIQPRATVAAPYAAVFKLQY